MSPCPTAYTSLAPYSEDDEWARSGMILERQHSRPPHRRRCCVSVPLGLGISVVPLDTAVNIAFPNHRSFGLPIPMIQWVVICYVLTHAGLMLAFGRVGDTGDMLACSAPGCLEHGRVSAMRRGAELRRAAVLSLSAGDRRRADHQLRAGAGHRALSGGAAQPGPGIFTLMFAIGSAAGR